MDPILDQRQDAVMIMNFIPAGLETGNTLLGQAQSSGSGSTGVGVMQ